MEKVIEILKKFEKEKFWGKLTFTLKDGKPVHLDENKSHKLD